MNRMRQCGSVRDKRRSIEHFIKSPSASLPCTALFSLPCQVKKKQTQYCSERGPCFLPFNNRLALRNSLPGKIRIVAYTILWCQWACFSLSA